MAVPEWLNPYMKGNAYIPTQSDIEKIEPQSRLEVFLKYIALNQEINDESFLTSDGYRMMTSDGLIFKVKVA